MGRHSLGCKYSVGVTETLWRIRVPSQDDIKLKKYLKEGETVSSFIRLAVKKEIERRKRDG
jgi:hypothetical protein